MSTTTKSTKDAIDQLDEKYMNDDPYDILHRRTADVLLELRYLCQRNLEQSMERL